MPENASPVPKLNLPRHGFPPVGGALPAGYAPKPPVAPRGTTADMEERTQSLALEIWASEIKQYLELLQTQVVGAVATDESTTSATYTNLATTGPTITAYLPAGFKALVILTANVYGTGTPLGAGLMSFAVSGVLTQAAADNLSLYSASGVDLRASAMYGFQASTNVSGFYTFTAKYRSNNAQAAHFYNRQITVVGS